MKYKYKVYPIRKTDSLERGLGYHKKVEQILSTGDFERDADAKTNAMAEAFKKYIIPKMSGNILDGAKPEMWFTKETRYGHTLIGRVDGYNASYRCLIEHKTTSGSIGGDYWEGLENDEQILSYMYGMGVNHIYYTVCQTPTIRQKKDESDEEFEERCIKWYSIDTDTKICANTEFRTEDEIQEFAEQLDCVIDEMENCTLFYRNPNHCKKWGRMCEYFPICKHYNPDKNYIGFVKGEENAD